MNSTSLSPARRRAIVALVVVNALWGCSFPIMKCLNLQIDQHFGVTEQTASTWLRTASAAWMIAIRFGLALVLLCVFMPAMLKRVQKPHVLCGAAIGFVFFLGLVLQVIGLATIPASRSGFLTSLTVVFTPLIATIYRHRWPRIPVLLAAVVALAGVAVLTGLVVLQDGRVALAEDSLNQWRFGDVMTMLGAIVFSVQILLIDAFGKRYDSEAFTPSMFATTALLAAITFGLLYPCVPETSAANTLSVGTWRGLATQPSFMIMIVFLCLFPSLLAFTWMNKYQPALSAGQAAVVYTFEPVFASLWAMVLPAILSVLCSLSYTNEQFSVPLLIGGALVLLANVLALWPERD